AAHRLGHDLTAAHAVDAVGADVEALVDLLVTVVVDAVAALGHLRVDGGVLVVAVAHRGREAGAGDVALVTREALAVAILVLAVAADLLGARVDQRVGVVAVEAGRIAVLVGVGGLAGGRQRRQHQDLHDGPWAARAVGIGGGDVEDVGAVRRR